MFLGVTLLIYALTALASLHIKVQKAHEPWLGPIIGAVTGIITAATGRLSNGDGADLNATGEALTAPEN